MCTRSECTTFRARRPYKICSESFHEHESGSLVPRPILKWVWERYPRGFCNHAPHVIMADEEASSSSTDSNQGEEARAVGEGEEADTVTHGGKKWSLRGLTRWFHGPRPSDLLMDVIYLPPFNVEVVFPRLTMHKGQEVLSVKKSTVVIVCLYSSHILSSWVS